MLQELTDAELLGEWYEDLYVEKGELETLLADGEGEYQVAVKRLGVIYEALGEDGDAVADPLIDKWERQLANGEIPDLEEGLEDA